MQRHEVESKRLGLKGVKIEEWLDQVDQSRAQNELMNPDSNPEVDADPLQRVVTSEDRPTDEWRGALLVRNARNGKYDQVVRGAYGVD